MPGRKNPMCNTFPRIGDVIIMRTGTGRMKMTISMRAKNPKLNCMSQLLATTGDGAVLGFRRTSTQSVFLP